MGVTYTKQQRQVAKDRGLHLVTLDIPGYGFQGPVDDEQRKQIEEFMIQFMKDRQTKLKAGAA